VTTGAYRAVEFIKANIRLEGVEKASVEDSKKVVQICTQYAQKGMFNIFLTVFFSSLAFAFVEEYFFIGYLISIAIFGLYQAIFMANAAARGTTPRRSSRSNSKPKARRCTTPRRRRHCGRPVQRHFVGGAEPVIKFTTLFGLLAVNWPCSCATPAAPTKR
jgi:K(+)-stimulated pyrophosphate-energized sodium pump